MRVIAIIAALIAVGLAGCADSDGNANDTGVSAANGMQAEALAWNPAAQLVYLESLEFRSDNPLAAGAAPSPEVGTAFTAVLNEPIGDGRSSLWAGIYEADGASLLMFWSPSGVLMQNETSGVPFTSALNVSRIQVDSDEAADILAAADGNWSAVRDEVEIFGATTLVASGDDLYWNFMAFGNETTMSGIVNAVTGNITDDLTIEQETFAGSLSIGAGQSASATFTLASGHAGLAIDFAKSGGEPPLVVIGAGFDVVVTDPQGQSYSFTISGVSSPQFFPGIAGEWEISATSNDLLLASTLSYTGYSLD